jgi:hypothetical protein
LHGVLFPDRPSANQCQLKISPIAGWP